MTTVKPTLAMVAREAGVSPSTVSRILNGTARVDAAKTELVNAVIARLGFRPDPMARSLAGGKTMSIGVLTQYIDSPFYGEALRGIEDELRRAEYVPLFVSGHWNETEELDRLNLLRERKVDGVIILTGRLSDATLLDISAKVPLVITGRILQAPNLISIDFDNFEGARMAVRHLHALRHEQIAYISGPLDHPDAQQRLDGFLHEKRELGLKHNDLLMAVGDFQETGGFLAMNTLLQMREPFTAVVAGNDQMAYGARLALQRAALRVPEDISLVGFDDLPHSAFTLPPLTSIRQSVYEMGVMSAKAMLSLIKGHQIDKAIVAAELVVRESTRLHRR
jgi:LacI family transcriptional regulator